jgi:polygalacturonase
VRSRARKLPAGSSLADVAEDKKIGRAVKTATAFVAAHGKPARAVVENVGRAGARVVLVGDDGAMGDVVLPDVASAEAVVEAVADLDAHEWDRETTAAVRIGPAHRRKMAGR